ncbi:asparagine synthase-related protein [Aquimarina algiphila]|uniref:asparagine synthase-related protein n=1 Tax=Aquimarina algiphila TaxID=2047982 RepID=UPI00248FB6E4|nr:asparagine synthase-related protein [Aquimarina algiphila]
MSDFILLHKELITKSEKKNLLKVNRDWSLLINKANYSEYNIGNNKIIIIGDYIGAIEEIFSINDNEISKLKGHFYAIIVKENSVKIYNSFFSMLPVYYTTDECMISSSLSFICEYANAKPEIDRKYILENLLFNYGFFNRTLYKNIKLLACHSFITLKNSKITIAKHFDISTLFVSVPKGGKKIANQLSDLFIKTVKNYFPEEEFNIAFTSGFDGRTLVSCATHHYKKFKTFSFGRPENDDVSIPLANAKTLKIPYQFFDLGDVDYTTSEYYKNALEYATSGYLGNGFLYPHFLYSTKKISENSNHLLSGAAGSELFRALHSTGAVTSQALANVFKIQNEEELREAIKNAEPLHVLNTSEFAKDLDELIDEIITYKKSLPQNISKNQQFYIFVFEEIFRKFFGQWVTVQQKHLTVRTPFLDYSFVKALLTTKYAGANNDFFTDNPLKRMKGQYLYTDIIKKTNTQIYKQTTGKGYRPIDVRDIRYIHNIIFPFLKKKILKKVTKTNFDNLGIISGIKANEEKLHLIINSEQSFFDTKILESFLKDLSPYTPEKHRDTLLMSLSILHNLSSHSVSPKINTYEVYNSINGL